MIPSEKSALRPAKLGLIVVGCLALSVLFFAPRLWLMHHYVAGSFQWDRAHTYLLQCEQPFRRDIEPAMQWRLLPPVVAHFLGLPGQAAFILPWLGVVALLAYVAVLHARRLPEARFVFGGTLLAATTAAVVVPVGWLGINDAWVWLGLLAIAFGRSSWALALACLLCPWIDERFLIGLPLAWVVRCLDNDGPFLSRRLVFLASLLPYVAIRIVGGGNPATAGASHQFIVTQLTMIPTLLAMAPLGWWMGLRVGWLGVGYASWGTSPVRRLVTMIVLGLTLFVSLTLASDISRSVAIALPVVLLGGFALARRDPARAAPILLVAGCINLVLPAAHVVLNKIDPINPLPVEIFRLLRVP